MNTCPCCKQEISARGLQFSPETGVAIRDGSRADLTPYEAAVFAVIHKNSPKFTPATKLINALYGAEDGPLDERGVLNVLLLRMRRKLAPIGVKIENQYGLGYRVEIGERAAA
jgi:DNA-binding response OmpR family regulator